MRLLLAKTEAPSILAAGRKAPGNGRRCVRRKGFDWVENMGRAGFWWQVRLCSATGPIGQWRYQRARDFPANIKPNDSYGPKDLQGTPS